MAVEVMAVKEKPDGSPAALSSLRALARFWVGHSAEIGRGANGPTGTGPMRSPCPKTASWTICLRLRAHASARRLSTLASGPLWSWSMSVR